MFEQVEEYLGDPILTLMENYMSDPRPEKVNLSIGMYYNEAGVVPVLDCISKARELYFENETGAPYYLPMEGMLSYRQGIQKVVFGESSKVLKENKVATIQTLGGTGGLREGADFLHQWFPKSKVYLSNPTWPVHKTLFASCGFEVGEYPYYDESTGTINFQKLLDFFETLESRSIVVLHACCHNPTGEDLTHEQWNTLIEVMVRRNLFPFVDMAYQGLGEGMEEDAYAVRAMADAGLNVLVSNSFSKIFSLYGERVGGLSIVCTNEKEMRVILGQLKYTVRRNYSTPPSFGAHLVSRVLNDETLFPMWVSEVEGMRQRIVKMRKRLFDTVVSLGAEPSHFEYLVRQRGMFSYTGYSVLQAQKLRKELAIYILDSGRISVAGLNDKNIGRVAKAMVDLSL